MLWVALARDGRWEGQTSLPSNTVSGAPNRGFMPLAEPPVQTSFRTGNLWTISMRLMSLTKIPQQSHGPRCLPLANLLRGLELVWQRMVTKFGFMEGSGWERIITTTCMSTTSRAIALRHLQVALKSRPFTTLSIALAVVLRPSIRMAVPSMTAVLDMTWTVTTSIPTTSPAIAGPPSAALRIPAFDPLEVLFTCSRRA